MTKKIKHVYELPEWFKLENYKKTKDMSLYDWHVQLVFRKHCLTCKNISALVEPIEIIRRKIVIQLSDHHYFNLWYQIDNRTNLEKFVMAEENPAISSLTMRNFFNIEKFLLPEKKTYQPELTDTAIDFFQSVANGNGGVFCLNSSGSFLNSALPNQEWLNEPIYKSASPDLHGEGLINVNLDFSDDVLVEQFKKWLLDIRSNLDIQMNTKKIKQSDVNSWILYGALPYIDLKIWEREMNISVPNRVMSDAIYFPGVGGEETVRKTTSTLVERLLSDTLLKQLGGQINLQNPE